MVAVKVREEHRIDRTRVNATAVHMREQRCAAVQEKASVHYDRPVVSLW
jgi:hypothetical protein